MTKPENFILNSDYATLKNDGSTTLSVTLPDTLSIPPSTTYSISATASLGVAGASTRQRISSTKNAIQYITKSVVYSYTSGATVIGEPFVYWSIFVFINRRTSDSVDLTVFIPNQYGNTMNITGLSQTITAKVATFLPPKP